MERRFPCTGTKSSSVRNTRFIETELPRIEALNEPDDAAGEGEELNGFFRRYAIAA